VKALAADPQINKLLQKHLAKYASAYYGYIGPAMTAEHLLTNLQLLVAEGKDPYDQLRRLNKEFQQVLADRKKTEQALRLTPKEKYVFKALRDTIFMKLYRRDSISHSFHMMEPIIREYARRAGLSYEEATHIAPGEYPKMLKNKTAQRQLKHRLIYCVIPGVRKSSRQLEVLHGQKARKYIKNLYQEQSWGDLKEVQGQVACVGKNTLMRGTVKIVNVPADMKKMQVGDILVSQATSPEIVSAMKKAAAIVTEQGGITSHASIVSRELNIACVIGTKIATQIFKDGDKVEVNTNTGLVSKI
jgi:phosphohistidine swiveling domain-containing protein